MRKLVLRTSCPNKRQKLNATANAFGCPSRPATLASYPTRGMKHSYAMTRRDVGRQRIFTPQTTLRENTQPYRFWGLKIFTPLTLRFQDFQRRFFLNGPRSLTTTTIDRPLCKLVTRTLLGSGKVLCAAEMPPGEKWVPMAVFEPDSEPYQDAIPFSL